jgi:hypothetical protein
VGPPPPLGRRGGAPPPPRRRALADTGAARTSLTAPGGFADGEWQHVALTRSRDTVTLYMNGQPVAEAASPVGSTSTDARHGVHLGQRPDGANPMTGALDEMYLYDRALSAAEIGILAGDDGDADGGPDAPEGAVVHLPLEQTRPHPVRPDRPVVVADDNARGGQYLRYEAQEPGDYVEIPFGLDEAGEFEVAVRQHRRWNHGKIQVSIDGEDLPDGLVDLAFGPNESFRTFQHGTVELDRGRHRIRFTLVDEGHLGGTVIAPDQLTLISGGGAHELVRDVALDDESVGAFEMSGSWSRASGQDGHPYFGVSYRSAPSGSGDRTARWRPDVPVTDTYQVLVWYVSHPNRASDAPYTVHHAEGSTTVEVDQRGQARSLTDADRPGVWVNLGSFRFEAGSAASIELSNDANGFVVADGVVLTRDPVPDTPTDVEASGASSSIEVSWSASEGAHGYHIERREAGDGAWEFAGEVSASETSFTSTGLSADTAYEHRVYAVVGVHVGRPARASVASASVDSTTHTVEIPPDEGDIEITTLSGRPDSVTGGDALVQVTVPADVTPDELTVSVDGADVTSEFVVDADGVTLTGLVSGLRPGANAITATAHGEDAHRTTLSVTNYPIQGPVFSGPHQQPFACGTAAFQIPVIGGTLGAPIDEDCSIATRVDYFYATGAGDFQPWPDAATGYPDDLATTTTSEGVESPFIVRMETGTANRAIYQSTVLHDPLAESEPSFDSPPAAWNGVAIFTLGGGCNGGWYRQGTATGGVTDRFMLGQGYGVVSSTLNVFGVNCHDVTAAETAMMVKERFIEQYGSVDRVIGYGASGGAYQGHQIADNYPGIFDGIVVGSSFPEVAFGTVNFITDAWLLDTYFTEAAEVGWTEEEQRAVTGFETYATATNVAPGARRIDPRTACTMVSAAERYDPDTNPTGVRCGVFDHAVNVYGRDAETGFARRPMDNVGVQYGLGALNDGAISAEQFLDLNERVGGFDVDANVRPERTSADVDAVRIAYQTGRLTNGGGGLAEVPIIDWREYRDDNPNGDIHVRYHTFSMRERLQKANGTTANHVSLLESARYGFSTNSPLISSFCS